jgi:hypothetical protein
VGAASVEPPAIDGTSDIVSASFAAVASLLR